MEKLTLEFTTQLKESLINNEVKHSLPILENLEIRAKGYNNFFGDIALPFGVDDYFADFMLAKYDGKPFFTIKHTTFGHYKKYNLKNPIESLMSKENNYQKISNDLNINNQSSWIGGLTYLKHDGFDSKFIKKISLELTLLFVQHILFKKRPTNIIVTANLKANFNIFLHEYGFQQLDHPNVIHPELGNNEAAIMSINQTNQLLLDNYYKYNLTELISTKAA